MEGFYWAGTPVPLQLFFEIIVAGSSSSLRVASTSYGHFLVLGFRVWNRRRHYSAENWIWFEWDWGTNCEFLWEKKLQKRLSFRTTHNSKRFSMRTWQPARSHLFLSESSERPSWDKTTWFLRFWISARKRLTSGSTSPDKPLPLWRSGSLTTSWFMFSPGSTVWLSQLLCG